MKTQIKPLFLRWTLLIAMALLLCNCQKDELPTDVENTLTPISQSPIQKIQYHQLPSYIKDQVNNSAESIQDKGWLKKGSTPFGEVLQDQVGVLTTNDGVSSYTLGMKNLKSNYELSIDNLVITENSDGTLSSQILRYKPAEKWLQNRSSKGLNWDNYSGEIMIYDGRGKLKAVGEFLNGDATRKTNNKEMSGRNDEMDCVVTDVSVAGLEQNGEFYPTDIIIDYHCSSGGGAGGGSDHGLPNGGGEFPHNTGGSHGGGRGSSGNEGPSDPSQIPTVIDDRLLDYHLYFGENITRCVQSIIYKLQRKDMQNLTLPDIGQLAGTSHLSQIILDIFDGSDEFNLKFDIGEAGTNKTGSHRNASTIRDKDAIKPQWNITLDDDYVRNATDLAIARTIIHESIHAFIGYSLHRDKTSDMAYELNLLYQSKGKDKNLAQHEFISQFVEALALSLSIWDNRQESDSYYQKLAWAGLEKTDAYQSKSKADKSEIQEAILNEQLSTRNAKGNKCQN